MRNVEFEDKDGRVVTLNYKNENDMPNGNHVLAIPVYNSQLLFTHHQQRGIEFPGGKVIRRDGCNRKIYLLFCTVSYKNGA